MARITVGTDGVELENSFGITKMSKEKIIEILEKHRRFFMGVDTEMHDVDMMVTFNLTPEDYVRIDHFFQHLVEKVIRGL